MCHIQSQQSYHRHCFHSDADEADAHHLLHWEQSTANDEDLLLVVVDDDDGGDDVLSEPNPLLFMISYSSIQ